MDSPQLVVLDMNTKIPLCGEQEHGAYNGPFESFGSRGRHHAVPSEGWADWLHWPHLLKESHNAMNMQPGTRTKALNKAL